MANTWLHSRGRKKGKNKLLHSRYLLVRIRAFILLSSLCSSLSSIQVPGSRQGSPGRGKPPPGGAGKGIGGGFVLCGPFLPPASSLTLFPCSHQSSHQRKLKRSAEELRAPPDSGGAAGGWGGVAWERLSFRKWSKRQDEGEGVGPRVLRPT